MEAVDMSAMIGSAAQQAGLGGHRAAYPATMFPESRLKVGAAVTGVAVLLVLIGLATGTILLWAFAGIFAVVFGVRVARVALLNRQKRGQQLHLYEQGLVCVGRNGQITVRRWDSSAVYQNIVRHYRNGAYTHTSYHYRLVDPAGHEIALAGGFARPTEWGQAIQQAVTDAQFPHAMATVRAGGAVRFGDITLALHTVSASGKTVPWSQIQEIKVKDGRVSLRVEGRWLSLTTTMVRSIPNFFVFHALAERLRQAAAGPAR